MGRYDHIFDKESDEWNGWGLSQVTACERKLCFKDSPMYSGKPIGPDTQRMFGLGNVSEDVMKVTNRQMQLTMQQFKVSLEGRNGRLDGVILDEQFNEALLWEHKSMSFRAYSMYLSKTKKGQGLHQTKPQYYGQIQSYFRALMDKGVMFYEKFVQKAIFSVMQRDMGLLHVTTVDYNPKFVDSKIRPRIIKVNQARKDKVILPKPDGLESWECNYCDFKSTCKKMSPNTVSY